MKQGLGPIKGDPTFLSFFTQFDTASVGGLLLCIAVGAILTIIVQSSSATIGLTMTFAAQGLIPFPTAMALVLGENIGTTITAQLATIGANNVNAYCAARAHAMFNIIGVVIMVSIFPYFISGVEIITYMMGAGPVNQVIDGDVVNIGRYIANGHTLFNVVNAIIFLFFLPQLIKVATWISPSASEEDSDLFRKPNLDDRFLDNPIAALTQARGEIIRMAQIALLTLKSTVEALETRDVKKLSKWRQYESHLDLMQKEINAHLTRVFQNGVNEAEAKEISGMIRMSNNIERVGDAVENIAEMAEEIIDAEISFSEDAMTDVKALSNQAVAFVMLIIDGIQKKGPNFMVKAQTIEDNIDFMREEMRQNHIHRLRRGICSNEPGLMFSDILSNFEKIGDYCYNVAQGVAGVK